MLHARVPAVGAADLRLGALLRGEQQTADQGERGPP
ncbi:hypothetical protein RKD37_005343 [Streptomyces ambofaciens]